MDTITRIFINRQERRLRAGWRFLLWIILTLLISTLIALAIQSITGGMTPNAEGKFSWIDQGIAGVGSVIAITAGVFIARRLFDCRTITSLGLRVNWQAVKDLLAGFLIAGVIMFLIFYLERLAGWLTVDSIGAAEGGPGTMLAGLGIMFLAFVVVGWQEELFARGYLLQNLDDGLGFLGRRYSVIAAVLLSSAVFGLAHLGNPNATWVGAVGTGLAGVFLAYAYLASGQLWLPIGIHIGWNFFEGPGERDGFTLLPGWPDSTRPEVDYRRWLWPGGRADPAPGPGAGGAAGMVVCSPAGANQARQQ
jgi:uncharacterized protein